MMSLPLPPTRKSLSSDPVIAMFALFVLLLAAGATATSRVRLT
jgi:hypothetical protein